MNDVTVNVRKFDGSLRRTWECRTVDCTPERIVLVGVFADNIEHAGLGSIVKGTVSYEYYWPSRWYNIFRFHEPSGHVRNYYCNIGMPPTFDGSILEYTDLDIDIVYWPDSRVEVLDELEFEENAVKYCYPPEVYSSALSARDQMLEMIRTGGFQNLTQ